MEWTAKNIRENVIGSCDLLISEAQLDIHLVEELDSEGEPIIRTQKQQIKDWKTKMSKNGEYADQIFVQLFSSKFKKSNDIRFNLAIVRGLTTL